MSQNPGSRPADSGGHGANVSQNTAARTPPADTPVNPGAARGLRVIACNTAPDRALRLAQLPAPYDFDDLHSTQLPIAHPAHLVWRTWC